MDENGGWQEDNEAMKNLIENYFQHLFTSEVDVVNMDVINKVTPRVTTYMNEALLASYTEEEVKHALFSIGDLKAPGPDGLNGAYTLKKLDPF